MNQGKEKKKPAGEMVNGVKGEGQIFWTWERPKAWNCKQSTVMMYYVRFSDWGINIIIKNAFEWFAESPGLKFFKIMVKSQSNSVSSEKRKVNLADFWLADICRTNQIIDVFHLLSIVWTVGLARWTKTQDGG